MNSKENIAKTIQERLSPEAAATIDAAGNTASAIDMKIYLVGGVVRDILLGRENHDLDIVVEGNAIELAYQFADDIRGTATVHPRFRTATVKWDNRSVDFVTARSETYAKPGALPTVQPGTIDDDLARRDFTVNSIAVNLSPEGYGNLIDPSNGRKDLEKKYIRILHEKSFIDDATRIWRAVRYEQRLGFTIEPETLSLLKENLSMLKTISRDRIRHELELVLKEACPEKALVRAGELGLLDNLYRGLKGDRWLAEKFEEARKTCSPENPPSEMYMALLACRLNKEQIKEFSKNLNLRKKQASVLNDVILLKGNLTDLSKPDIQPSAVYELLHGISATALTAVFIAEDDPNIHKNIALYRDKLSHIRPSLTGKDLTQMGFSSGPAIKKVLQALLVARLDGTVSSKEDEIEMVNRAYPHR